MTDLRRVPPQPACAPSKAAGRVAAGILGFALPAMLGAQALPGLPVLPAPASRFPEAEDLLPFRPFGGQPAAGSSVPFEWRGEEVRETPEAWILERGAIRLADLLLLADQIRYQPASGELVAEGHIRLEAPDFRLRCARLSMNWVRRTGEAWALELDLPPSWTLKSRRVQFTELKHWAFEAVEISSCPEEQPGWSAQLSSLKLDLDAFATLRNARIRVGGVPVLWLPWAMYPAKAERSSGLLPPLLGYSGRLGATVGLSYYQVLGSTADLTFSPTFYSKEGVLWGSSLRWNPEPTHQGSLAGLWIRQRSDQEKRYRLEFQELWQREDGWQIAAQVNQASDNLMEADFGRSVGGIGLGSFDSSVHLGRSFRYASVSVAASEQRTFFQPEDPFYRWDYPASLKRRVLPQVQLRVFPIPIGAFYLDGGFRVGRLSYRILLEENGREGHYTWGRDDGILRLSGRLGQWGPMRADLQLQGRYTRYGATLQEAGFDPDAEEVDRLLSPAFDPFRVEGPSTKRWLGSGRLQLSGPQLGRNFPNFSLLGYHGELKHVLEPFYAFTQNSRFGAAGRIPRFDDADSRPGVNGSAMGEQSVEVGLKQHLLGRPGKGIPFADLVRWKVSTRFHFQPILLGDGRTKRGWTSIDNDIDVEPDERLRISFKRTSDPEGGSDNALSAEYKAADGSRLTVSAFSTGINRFLVRQRGVQFGGMQRVWDDRLRFEFQVNYDFRQRAFATSQAALAYVTPCVAASLRYSHLTIGLPGSGGKEDRLDLVLTLRGIGDLFSWRP